MATVETADAPERAPRGMLIVGIVLTIGSLVVGVGAAVVAVLSLSSLEDVINGVETAPYGDTVTFTAAEETSSIWGTTESAPSCEVVLDDGSLDQVDVRRPSGAMAEFTFETSNSEAASLEYFFDSEIGESYMVSCSAVTNGEFGVASIPGLLMRPGRVVAIFAGLGLCALLFFVGCVLWITAVVRRSRWRRAHGGGPRSAQLSPGYGGGAPPAAGGTWPSETPGYVPPPGPGQVPPPPMPQAPYTPPSGAPQPGVPQTPPPLPQAPYAPPSGVPQPGVPQTPPPMPQAPYDPSAGSPPPTASSPPPPPPPPPSSE